MAARYFADAGRTTLDVWSLLQDPRHEWRFGHTQVEVRSVAPDATYIADVTRLLAVLCLVPLLGGCTVETVGKAGVGVDAQGQLIGYLAVCDQHIDGATLYLQDTSAPATGGHEVTAGEWASDQPVTEMALWSLKSTTDGWTTTTPLTPLEADRTYSLYGWTRDNSGSALDVTFKPAQLKDLKPGEVYFFDHYDMDRNQEVFATSSPTEFLKAACRP